MDKETRQMETGKANPTIPVELKALPNWVCWKIVTRDAKPTKPPVNPFTGELADSSDPATWGDYETALRYFEAHKRDGIKGIGFEFGNSPFAGVDLDHVRDPETGTVETWAQEIIDKADSYAEISPSGTGVHIFAIGQLPGGGRRRGDVEMYEEGRYFTSTGNHLDGTPLTIEKRTAQLAAIHRQYIGKDEPPKIPDKPETPVNASDEELLRLMVRAANGERVRKLLDGDHSDYSTQSEADIALCNHLAFWTGKDPERIDRLFRASGLFRDKWDKRHHGDGSTYGEETIRRAIERTTEIYTPATPKDAGGETPSETHGNNAGHSSVTGITPSPRPIDKKGPIDPTRYLRTGAQLQEMEITVSWLVEDLIPENSITPLVGPAGYGKSTVCLNLANAVDRGLSWLGRETIQKPVYVLDFENPLAVDVERSRALDLSGVLFWHTSAEVPPPRIDSPEYEAYKRLSPGLVIVDGHRASQRGDENSSQDTGLVMERWKELRDLGFTIVLIHHTTKANAEVFRGSQALVDQADHVLYFYPVRRPGADDPIDLEDPDSMTYFLGTKDKTRFKACRLYLKRAGNGRFTLAGNPDDEKIELLTALLSDREELTQNEFMKAAKEEAGYGKDLMRRLLKLGETRGTWTMEKGARNSFVYHLSQAIGSDELSGRSPFYKGGDNPTTTDTKGNRVVFPKNPKNDPTTLLPQELSGDFDSDPTTRQLEPFDSDFAPEDDLPEVEVLV
jgi:putative DNA primase/helicase